MLRSKIVILVSFTLFLSGCHLMSVNRVSLNKKLSKSLTRNSADWFEYFSWLSTLDESGKKEVWEKLDTNNFHSVSIQQKVEMASIILFCFDDRSKMDLGLSLVESIKIDEQDNLYPVVRVLGSLIRQKSNYKNSIIELDKVNEVLEQKIKSFTSIEKSISHHSIGS